MTPSMETWAPTIIFRMGHSPCLSLHEGSVGFIIDAQRGQKVAVSLQRCGHPGQQHGLRMPPRSLSMPTSMRRFLVSSFLADVTQQIHSFRASGVISVQTLFAAALDSMAFRKSAGSLCTVPPAIFCVVIRLTVPVSPNETEISHAGCRGKHSDLITKWGPR